MPVNARLFDHYIGIDYSGAATPDTSLPGLQVYEARRGAVPRRVVPPGNSRRHWTRRQIGAWLVTQLRGPERIIIGIDHALSFPALYFERYGLGPDWRSFLDDLERHWPCAEPGVSVQDVRDGRVGAGAWRRGDSAWPL